MLNEITNIKIQGNYFEDEANLELFDNCNNKVCIIYGRNGSGKTTISEAIKDYKNDTQKFKKVEFLNNENKCIGLSKKDIYVFNEKYIEDNVKWSSDTSGLNAIVLFGEIKDIDEKINLHLENVKKEKENIELRNIEQFTNPSSPTCLEEAFKNIKKAIQDGWAVREQKIKKLTRKATVNDEQVFNILNLKEPDSLQDDCQKKFDELIIVLENTQSATEPISPINIDLTKFSNKDFLEKLNSVYDEKVTTEFAKKVFSIISTNGSDLLKYTNKLIEKPDVCPVCFQSVSKSYMEGISKIIEELFDETITKEKEKLKLMKIETLQWSNSDNYINVVDLKKISHMIELIKEYNKIANGINENINIKTNFMHKSLSIEKLNLDEIKEKIQQELLDINNDITNYNDQVKKIEENKRQLQILNQQISFYEVESLKKQYDSINKMKIEAERENSESIKIIEKEQAAIKLLNSQKNNYGIAIDEINSLLTYVFSSSKRLYLEPGEDITKYYVHSKGKKINLNKLSVGERNIIALCYFLESMKSENNKNEYFKNESLIVIDDPISSFDFENKLGIYSLIKKQILEIKKQNENTRFIFLTHELDVCYSINKITKDLGIETNLKQLKNKTTDNLNDRKFSNYENLLHEIFNFANVDGVNNDTTIGNTMRKALEAYSNFNYKIGMDDFLTKPEYLDKITDIKLRNYFETKMYRLVLNSGSHTADSAHQIPDIFDFQLFSLEEQVQTAKDILVYLYLLDREHITRYFISETKAINKIKVWLEDIKKII